MDIPSLKTVLRLCLLSLLLTCINTTITSAQTNPTIFDAASLLSRRFGLFLSSALSPLTVSSEISSQAPIPLLPTKGECLKDTVYIINDVNDLYNNIDQLECFYSVALPLDKVPLGALYGRILAFANTAFWNPLVELFYQGDQCVEIVCKGKTYYLNVLIFAGVQYASGVFYLGRLGRSVSPLEAYVDSEGLIMDFATNITELCPIEDKDFISKGFGFIPFHSDVNQNKFPVRLFKDHVRVVGRDTDGCLLLLGRTFMTDPLDPEGPVITSWYFTLKTCDPTVNASFTRNTPLPPLAKSFTYSRSSALELLQRGSNVIGGEMLSFYASRLDPSNKYNQLFKHPWNNTNIPTTKY